MLEQFTQLTGAICMMTRRTFKFPGSVERCWVCGFTLADYFSVRPDNFFLAIAHVVLSRAAKLLGLGNRVDHAMNTGKVT